MNQRNPPLYFECNPPAKLADDGHRGLWFDRFFNQYDQEWNIYKENKEENLKEGKRNWIRTVEGETGDVHALEAATDRLAKLCRSLNGEFSVFSASWHFVTGLGYPHPVESGFLWHPTSGTPYIPGASVKGLVRAWMEVWADEAAEDKAQRTALLHRWFGSEDKEPANCSNDSRAGTFIFFDALPTKPVELKADVMTPHMGDWYEKGGINPMNPQVTPADWHNPVPVPFLVADKPEFLFSVAPRDGEENKELGRVMAALASALAWLGAGAKTAAGYGHLDENGDEQKKISMRIKRAMMSEEERIEDEVKNITPKELSYMFGRNYNKVKKEKEESGSWDRFVCLIRNEHHVLIQSWKTSRNKNEQKCFKRLFGSENNTTTVT